jgi:ribosomal protein S18 acetylase RimI-like enzyme
MPDMTGTREAPGLGIREYRTRDYESVLALWAVAGLPFKPEGRERRKIVDSQVRQSNVIFLVAEIEGRLVGTVLATHDGRKGWINRLAVDPAYRRRGIGSKLVREAETRLEALGMDVLACLIEEGNEASVRTFETLGYEHQPEIQYFVKKRYPGA